MKPSVPSLGRNGGLVPTGVSRSKSHSGPITNPCARVYRRSSSVSAASFSSDCQRFSSSDIGDVLAGLGQFCERQSEPIPYAEHSVEDVHTCEVQVG